MRAEAKFVRISPRKARLVADHIRGRSVPEARTILAFTERAAAREVEKVLRSAVANAESNPKLHWDGDDSSYPRPTSTKGRRSSAGARARAAASRASSKRTCHITSRCQSSRTTARAGRRPRRRGSRGAHARRRDAPQEDRGDGALMGQKIHPGGLRVGVIHDWKSNWMVGKKEFAGALIEDIKIREHIPRSSRTRGCRTS